MSAKIKSMTSEVLVNIASFLSAASILELSMTCSNFSNLIKDEHVFRRLAERDFGIVDKPAENTWLDTYKAKKEPVNSVVTGEQTAIVAEEQPVTEEQTTIVAEEQTTVTEEQSTVTAEQITVTEEQTTVTEEQSTVAEEQSTVAEEQTTVTEEQPSNEEPVTAMEIDTVEELPSSSNGCPHVVPLSDIMCEVKRVLYKSQQKSLCDICLTDYATFLNMSPETHNEYCTVCISKPVEDENHYPIQLELATGDLYCYKCDPGNPRKLTSEDGPVVQHIEEIIKAPESEDDLDKRRKAEQFLYIQELRREDMSLMHYLVEKQWGRNWMLFRTREGSPLPSRITNNKLSRLNGTLDPNIRLPMDKYRPSPETHGDIISEKLWSYLVKAYGVHGKPYSEDDIFAPEYARLRVYVDDYKKSIHLYP